MGEIRAGGRGGASQSASERKFQHPHGPRELREYSVYSLGSNRRKDTLLFSDHAGPGPILATCGLRQEILQQQSSSYLVTLPIMGRKD